MRGRGPPIRASLPKSVGGRRLSPEALPERGPPHLVASTAGGHANLKAKRGITKASRCDGRPRRPRSVT